MVDSSCSMRGKSFASQNETTTAIEKDTTAETVPETPRSSPSPTAETSVLPMRSTDWPKSTSIEEIWSRTAGSRRSK